MSGHAWPSPPSSSSPPARPALQSGAQTGGAGGRWDCPGPRAGLWGGSHCPGLRERRLSSPPRPSCPHPEDRGALPVGAWRQRETAHLGPGTGVAQDVGAGDQAVPEAATPTAPHTAVAAGDRDAGGGGARGDGSAHRGSGAAGLRLIGRLPALPAQHRAGAQVVLGGVPRAAAVGSLRRETRLRGSGECGAD